MVFVGSHYGDSQIVRIHSGPLPGTTPLSLPMDIVATSITTASPESTNSKGKQRAADMDAESTSNRGTIAKMEGTVVEVVQTIPGLSPIVDAVIADVDSSGQPQLVVCSGGQGAGAIKVVRKGAELQEHVVVDGFENITHVWPLRPTSAIQESVFGLFLEKIHNAKRYLVIILISWCLHSRAHSSWSFRHRCMIRYWGLSTRQVISLLPTSQQLQLPTWLILPRRLAPSLCRSLTMAYWLSSSSVRQLRTLLSIIGCQKTSLTPKDDRSWRRALAPAVLL
jgi:hypothetical protein